MADIVKLIINYQRTHNQENRYRKLEYHQEAAQKAAFKVVCLFAFQYVYRAEPRKELCWVRTCKEPYNQNCNNNRWHKPGERLCSNYDVFVGNQVKKWKQYPGKPNSNNS